MHDLFPTRNSGKHRPPSARFLITLIPVLLLLLTVFTITGCGSSSSAENEAPAPAETSSKAVSIQKGNVNQEDVEKMIVRKVGSVDYAGDPIIHEVTLASEAGGTSVIIGVGRPPSCHPGQVVGYITEMSRQFMSSLFLYDDVSKVEVALYGTTENVEDKNTLAAKATMTKADADKVDDWFSMDENTIGTMATEYWVEPEIYANWQMYGSSPITDPSLLEEANQ